MITDLEVPLHRWVDRGIITEEQADAIRGDLAGVPGSAPPEEIQETRQETRPETDRDERRLSLVAEALGYLGGALVLVASALAGGRFWDDLPLAVRLVIAGVAAAAALLAGAAVPGTTAPWTSSPGTSRPAAQRLRAVLWLLSAALWAWFVALAGDAAGLRDQRQAAAVATATAVCAASLWWRHRHLIQHLATAGAVVATAAALTWLLPDAATSPAATVWAVGVAWYLLGWGGVLRPRREVDLVGAVVAAGATPFFAAEPWGTPLALVTLAGLAWLAIRVNDLPLLAIAAVATLITLPAMVSHYFPGVLAAAAALGVVGLVLIVAAVVVVRRRAAGPGGAAPGVPSWSRGTAVRAWGGVALVLGATVAAVVVTAVV